jgi:hypothetical protein
MRFRANVKAWLKRSIDTAAIEAERFGLTTATLILRMVRLGIDQAEPDKVESMPRNNPAGKQTNRPKRF